MRNSRRAKPAEVIIHGALGQHERARNLALAVALVEREAEGLEHLSHRKSLCGHTFWIEVLEE